MKSGSKRELSPVSLRNLLIVVVLLLFAGAGAGFYLTYQQLAAYGQTVANSIAEADASKETATSLSNLKIALLQQQDIASLAGKLYAPNASWQAQAIKDIGNYAGASGLSIADYKIGQANQTDSDTQIPDITPPPADDGTEQLIIELRPPVSYTGLLKFLTYIQGNIPKMQVTDLTITRSNTPGTVTVPSITIKVYTR